MPKKHVLAAVAAVAAMTVLLFAVPSQAAGVDFTNPAFAPVSGKTSIPVGHAQFCKAHRDECRQYRKVVNAVALDETNWRQLIDVNNELNSAIVPVTDEDLYQVAEYWTYPDGYGDCEDIALAKRRQLIAAGWAPSALMMAVVREADGAGHAVLMVRTDRGDLILDNQDGNVRLWTDTPYTYVKRQSQDNPGEWVDILDNRAVVTTTASTN